ncbi:MAG: adenylate/guanylate cyclase domain-containing protein [Gallionella sp.]|nr:adenylate/guanylate cyclase domain-containing protein [Gallionella sp.]
MEDRSNKTIISSVLFLDMVEYSKKSVSGQISLKDRFNTYLSEAIHDVPVADRIILDTGDGAAVNFLGDVESALTAALRLRASLLNEDPYLEPQLLVRIGINLGPVRLVRDINGQPNIVGDGINVAQRVMGFADASQILVSRSYYDAVSRLSAQYTGMFHYQGSRTDKHVREHEIYAIGYPGDQTTRGMQAAESAVTPQNAGMLNHAVVLWNGVSDWLDNALERLVKQVRQADSRQRLIYSGVVAVPLLLLFAALVIIPAPQVAEIEWSDKAETPPVETMQDVLQPPLAVEKAIPDSHVTDKARPDKTRTDKTSRQPVAQTKQDVADAAKKHSAPINSSGSQVQHKPAASTVRQPVTDSSEPTEDAYIQVVCREGTQVFMDGAAKGAVISALLAVTVKPGKHKLIVNHASFGVYSEDVDVAPGKTIRIKPQVCN